MKSLLFPLLLSLTVFMLLSCKKSNPVIFSSGNQQILPLKIGNTWGFRETEFDTTGAIYFSGSSALSVTTDTVVSGETWYHLSSGGTAFYTNKSDGLWTMSVSASVQVQELILKYPASVGDSWNYYSEQVFVQSTDTSVTVPQGTYTCYEYRILYNSQPVQDYYLCPGVGIIVEDEYSSTNSGRIYKIFHSQLTSVTLK